MFDIDREHPEYTAKKATWKKYRDLYVGGEQFKANAAEYLIKRHREPLDVYYERLYRVFYENYLGSIVDWYGATLFRREPILSFQGPNEAGKAFYSDFVEDCDLRGSCLSDFFRKVLVEALVSGIGLRAGGLPALQRHPRRTAPRKRPAGRPVPTWWSAVPRTSSTGGTTTTATSSGSSSGRPT